MDKSIITIILVTCGLVGATALEFLAWNPERYSNLKSIPDSTATILIGVGLAITYFAYLYARKKGWWNVNSKYT